jgi:hypothetical protein
MGAGSGSFRWRLIERDGRPFFDISISSGVERSRDPPWGGRNPPWGGQYPPITLAANDAHSRRLRAGVRALARDELHVQSTFNLNDRLVLLHSIRIVEHFRLAEALFTIAIISIGGGKAIKVNQSKSGQIRPKLARSEVRHGAEEIRGTRHERLVGATGLRNGSTRRTRPSLLLLPDHRRESFSCRIAPGLTSRELDH